MSEEGARIISVADARATIREAAGRNVSCSFMIVVDPEMRPRKLSALLFVAREAAGKVLLDDFAAIDADLGPTVH
jgi:hypothetical protein